MRCVNNVLKHVYIYLKEIEEKQWCAVHDRNGIGI